MLSDNTLEGLLCGLCSTVVSVKKSSYLQFCRLIWQRSIGYVSDSRTMMQLLDTNCHDILAGDAHFEMLTLNTLCWILSCSWIPKHNKDATRGDIQSAAVTMEMLAGAPLVRPVIKHLTELLAPLDNIALLKRLLLLMGSLPSKLYCILYDCFDSLMDIIVKTYYICSKTTSIEKPCYQPDPPSGLIRQTDVHWTQQDMFILRGLSIRAMHNLVMFCPTNAAFTNASRWLLPVLSIVVSVESLNQNNYSSTHDSKVNDSSLSMGMGVVAVHCTSLLNDQTTKDAAVTLLTRVLSVLSTKGHFQLVPIGMSDDDGEADVDDDDDDVGSSDEDEDEDDDSMIQSKSNVCEKVDGVCLCNTIQCLRMHVAAYLAASMQYSEQK